MNSLKTLLFTPICSDTRIAQATMLLCLVGAVALIILSFRGMTRFELTQAESLLGVLLTFATAFLMICGGGVTYLIATRECPATHASPTR